ncbi:MFS transporter [Undibacterium sp.]|jgi:MFS family permease|uniref:MFS transporter n=1 Tax=Undibacterium sp. TaxID=1914977 RepID=UPI002CD30CED|nr:MFS transporter [Undibacterium sp.]HTD07037.1 MFS transporter [Undibacterium sp.]
MNNAKPLPSSARRLLLSSFVLMLGRSTATPFLAIYLTRRMGLDQQQVGVILCAAMVLATLFGLYAGYLADRFNKRRLMALAVAAIALLSLAVTWFSSAAAVVLVLACTDAAMALRSIALKALLAELLPVEQRSRAFSVNYTLINLGFAVGPMLGSLMLGFGEAWPFYVSAVFVMLSSRAAPRRQPSAAARPEKEAAAGSAQPSFKTTLLLLKTDRQLLLFTVGSLLSAFVYGRFVIYLSQYLMVSQGQAQASALIPYLITTNGVGVVALQYPIGKFIRADNMLRWIGIGSLMFVIGLLGFMVAATLPVWIFSMLLFTLGEVIVIPAEYLFIDSIAPASQKGSYYGVQNLATLGDAFSPLVCGVLLMHAAPSAMFAALIAAAAGGAAMYYAGGRRSRPVLCEV